jgi:hypothetical protein
VEILQLALAHGLQSAKDSRNARSHVIVVSPPSLISRGAFPDRLAEAHVHYGARPSQPTTTSIFLSRIRELTHSRRGQRDIQYGLGSSAGPEARPASSGYVTSIFKKKCGRLQRTIMTCPRRYPSRGLPECTFAAVAVQLQLAMMLVAKDQRV